MLTGLATEYYRGGGAALAGPLPHPALEQIARSGEHALDRFEEHVRGAEISYERRYSDDEPEAGLRLQARYADLLVLGQTDPADTLLPMLRQLPETLVLNGGRPVLLVPYAGADTGSRLDRHALVAWDGSSAATRAVTGALPLLRRTARVTVVVFNPTQAGGAHGEQPGADLALYLARHGVAVEVQQHTTGFGLDVGNALLSLAADYDADLLVAGAYGHLRWRELILGGVTRRLLQSTTLPVLMAH
jgi:nucleotide-binding universal stress UspA family protein